MYRFDSRFLRQFDSVTRQFSDPGEFRFYMAIHEKLSRKVDLDDMARIEVEKKPADKPRQHRISVAYDKATHSYVAKPSKLKIAKGDTVQWHQPKSTTQGYFVKVLDEKGNAVFNSQALSNNTVFTHFFSHPGDYHYKNILSDSDQRPVITVYQVDPRQEDWETLSKTPTLITYQNGQFIPDKIKVPEGGTVVWLVEGCDPVAIQLTCYDLDKIDLTRIPRPPRGRKGCKPDDEERPCKKGK